MGERLADDAYQQLRLATDDLIKHMGAYRVAVEDEIDSILEGRPDITRKQADFTARTMPKVKREANECDWAATRIQSFGMAYQCALMREEEITERRREDARRARLS